MIKLRHLLPETTMKTKHGSVIRRYHNNVGKQVGSSLYVHKLYADQIIPKAVLTKGVNIMTRSNPSFNYNCLMWDVMGKKLRFDEAPDFDSAREPHVGEYVVVSLDGSAPPKHGKSNSIWHHKWMWVKDDYTGFDVDKSKDWSRVWLSKLDEPAKGTDLTWQSQLRKHQLVEGKSTGEDVVHGGIWGTGRIVALTNVGGHTRDMGYNRWVYYQAKGIVFWHHYPPDEESNAEVANYLLQKGYEVKENRPMEDYYKVMGMVGKKKLDEGPWEIVVGSIGMDGTIRSEETRKTHTELGIQRGTCWRYNPKTKIVYWSGDGSEHDKDDEFSVENHIHKKYGYEVREHRNLEEFDPEGLGQDFQIAHGYMEEKLQVMEANQDEAALDFLKKMVRTGPFAGQVYLAGGAVRDMVMGQVPKDLDVVVTNNGKEGGMKFATWLAQQMGNYKEGSNPVLFPVFGTAKVVLTGEHNGVSLDGFDVEAVFARKEVYTPGSRKPEVFLGTIQDDAFRRDFTTNSLMMDLTTGEILDLTGQGKNDIKAGIIRTPSNPDEIFGQDALRMFRAIRFATKYDWNIDPATWEGIKNNLNNLGNTSMERVRDELDKILLTKNPARGIRLLRDVGLLPHVAKELQQAVGMTQNVHHKDDVFDHTLEVLKNTQPELVRRLTALFHDIGKVATRAETPTGVKFYQHESVGAEIVDRILRDLKYPTEIIDAVKAGVSNHMRLKQGGDDAAQLTDKALRKFKIELGNNLEAVLDVIHADNISHADASSMPNQIEKVRQRLQSLDVNVTKPNLPINGNDLIALGVPKGPIMSQILTAVADAWFENPNVTREQAIEIAKKFI